MPRSPAITRSLRSCSLSRLDSGAKRNGLSEADFHVFAKLGENGLERGLETETFSRGHMWTAPWQALFGVSNDLVGCGHMSGLLTRSICPLALMKSDDRDPYQVYELFAHDLWRGVPGLRWRPCRSSLLNALTKLEFAGAVSLFQA